MAEANTVLKMQNLDMKVWVLDDGKGSRAGVMEQGVTNSPTGGCKGLDSRYGLHIFSLALFFIYRHI